MTNQKRPILTAAALLCLTAVALGSWLPEERLSDSAGAADYTSPVNAKCIGCDQQGNVNVVWYSRVGSDYCIRYRRWNAAATAWDSALTISPAGMDARKPSLAVDDSGNVHVVWQADSTIYYRCRLAFGDSWGAAETVATRASASSPSVAARRPGFVVAAWHAIRSGSYLGVYCARRTGGHWSTTDLVSPSMLEYHNRASVGVDADSNVTVCWASTAGGGRAFARSWSDSVWGDIDTLLRDYVQDSAPSVAVEPGGVAHALAWLTDAGTRDHLVYRQRRAVGWADSVWLPRLSVQQEPGAVAVDESGRPHVVWCALSDNVTQVFHQFGDSLGQNWSAIDTLTAASLKRHNPSVSCGPWGSVQVVWYDQRYSQLHPDIFCRRFELEHDVGIGRLESPASVLDSGVTVSPAVWVRNNGRVPEGPLTVEFSIDSAVESHQVPSVPSHDSVRVAFATWQADSLGWHVVRCSTSVAGDEDSLNDLRQQAFFVRLTDVLVAAVAVGPDTVVQDTIVTPTAVVRNRGNDTSAVTAVMSIDPGGYADAIAVRLAAGADSFVSFQPWQAVPGSHVARCSVWCEYDLHPENDTLSRRFRVVFRDAGVSRIVCPADTVDSTVVERPQAVVANLGSEPAVFDVLLRIGSEYADTLRTVSLGPGDSAQVAFRDWRPAARGGIAVRCSTLLAGDVRPENDYCDGSVLVRTVDAAALAVIRPLETVSRGSVVPAARIGNRGNEAALVPARFVILRGTGAAYQDSIAAALAPGVDSVVEFAPWTAESSGNYFALCRTSLAGDMDPANDSVAASFRVAATDAALLGIESPAERVEAGAVTPRLRIANLGEDAEDILVRLRVGAAYEDSRLARVAAGAETAVVLRTWNALPGAYACTGWVWLGDDENHANDTLAMQVLVESVVVRRWTAMADIPAGPRRRGVRAGGSLCAVAGGVVALKGGNTGECWRYFVVGDSWHRCADMPDGASDRRPRHGTALCSDGNSEVYALKGHGTRELWRYDLAGDTWHALVPTPEFTREFRFGSSLAFAAGDTDRLFAVKASGTREFLAYWIQQEQWHSRRPLPAGADSHPARHGTAIVEMGGRLFCLKGGTCEFYEYFPNGDSWRARASLPWANSAGRYRKAKRGAALASDGSRYCHAFKGGGLSEFWRYDRQSDSWEQLEDVPDIGRRRRVRDGGALVRCSDKFYAFKGENCREFWRFDPDAAAMPRVRPERAGVQASGRVGQIGRIGPTEKPVYDAAGRRVAAGARRPGIYFVRSEAGGTTRTVKLVVPQ